MHKCNTHHTFHTILSNLIKYFLPCKQIERLIRLPLSRIPLPNKARNFYRDHLLSLVNNLIIVSYICFIKFLKAMTQKCSQASFFYFLFLWCILCIEVERERAHLIIIFEETCNLRKNVNKDSLVSKEVGVNQDTDITVIDSE